ncbi:peptide chain release factor 2-like [Pseudopipra pipra]|uniref:peptide chain release factor 2-like n=1 Tax=Pseudopipra pipra TaxID=415032 RepID=UPI0031392C8F
MCRSSALCSVPVPPPLPAASLPCGCVSRRCSRRRARPRSRRRMPPPPLRPELGGGARGQGRGWGAAPGSGGGGGGRPEPAGTRCSGSRRGERRAEAGMRELVKEKLPRWDASADRLPRLPAGALPGVGTAATRGPASRTGLGWAGQGDRSRRSCG